MMIWLCLVVPSRLELFAGSDTPNKVPVVLVRALLAGEAAAERASHEGRDPCGAARLTGDDLPVDHHHAAGRRRLRVRVVDEVLHVGEQPGGTLSRANGCHKRQSAILTMDESASER
jgi:hypothetical protein